MVKKSKIPKNKNEQTKGNKVKYENQNIAPGKKNINSGKNYKKNTIEDIKENKKLILVFAIALIFIIYCLYKVIVLIQNPTDTFSVEQGKIYQEEETVRIHY